MWVSEQILFALAKFLYKSNLAHSEEMKKALSERTEYQSYRRNQAERILSASKRYGVDIGDKVVLDMGCSDGAISSVYLVSGAKGVIGVDIDETAISRARELNLSSNISFLCSTTKSIPIADESVDSVICYDVFEHVSEPMKMLDECHRVLRPNGNMLIGTWGWHHPFAPHLWAAMPVPWAHVFVSEKTLLRACRRVYNSSWYLPNMHDIDQSGNKICGKYDDDSISKDYLNKLFIKDFENLFKKSKFEYKVFPQPFGTKFASWTKCFLKTPFIREFITSYIWVVLTKSATKA